MSPAPGAQRCAGNIQNAKMAKQLASVLGLLCTPMNADIHSQAEGFMNITLATSAKTWRTSSHKSQLSLFLLRYVCQVKECGVFRHYV